MESLTWAVVPRPSDVALGLLHVSLFSYYPGTRGVMMRDQRQGPTGSSRPCLWRALDHARIGLLSALTPAVPHARVQPERGRVYPFTVVSRIDRERGRERRRGTVDGADAQKLAVCNAVAGRGAEVQFVRVSEPRQINVLKGRSQNVRVNFVEASGTVLVKDPRAFIEFLAFGGPGSGKCYGCGLWHIPDLMPVGQQRHEVAA